jgi:hypothetical protein
MGRSAGRPRTADTGMRLRVTGDGESPAVAAASAAAGWAGAESESEPLSCIGTARERRWVTSERTTSQSSTVLQLSTDSAQFALEDTKRSAQS